MSEPVIHVERLGKVYNITHEQKASAGNATFRDAILEVAHKPIELLTGRKLQKEKFWALRDLSFDINRGDVVGIIGKNGSGKSTLLKILSRIVEPTEGQITMKGRTASLLEVGTGFHPELTGRENIFFNGAILGMKQQEIRAKFSDIVEFSGVEKFLDTPVKFYSSGMYVRLAFAVAAHLEPDILIIDEVLAVGDAEFQKKCLGKMKDVAGRGRTVIFVSHDMDAVESLCKKVIYMEKGKIIAYDETHKVQELYTSSTKIESSYITDSVGRDGLQQARITRVNLFNKDNKPTSVYKYREAIKLELELDIEAGIKLKDVHIDCNIFNSRNTHIACFSNESIEKDVDGNYIYITLLSPSLAPGTYSMNLSLLTSMSSLQDFIPDAIRFSIAGSSKVPSSNSGITQGDIIVDSSNKALAEKGTIDHG